MSKKISVNSIHGQDDTIIQEILMKKCSPGSIDWTQTLDKLRNLESMNIKDVSCFYSELIVFLNKNQYDDCKAVRKEKEDQIRKEEEFESKMQISRIQCGR